MNVSTQVKVVSLSIIVLLTGKLLYSYLIDRKPVSNSYISTPLQSQTPELNGKRSVMSNILRNHKILSSNQYPKLSKQLFTLRDKMTNVEIKCNFPIHFYADVSSTMDKAKALAKLEPNEKMFVVLADRQHKGRGTRGRTWVSGRKNMFLTVAIKQSILPIPLNFVPLRIGTIIGSCISSRVTLAAQGEGEDKVKLKWPNDILIDGKKVCGVLIEIEGGNLIVGIGCNVLSAPEVVAEGANGGRPSTCIAHHNAEMSRYLRDTTEVEASEQSRSEETCDVECSEDEVVSNTSQEIELEYGDYHKQLALDICAEIDAWLEAQSDSPAQVLSDFELGMDRSVQRLRDSNNHASALGEEVQPLGLDKEGTLMVRSLHNGMVKALIADYLW